MSKVTHNILNICAETAPLSSIFSFFFFHDRFTQIVLFFRGLAEPYIFPPKRESRLNLFCRCSGRVPAWPAFNRGYAARKLSGPNRADFARYRSWRPELPGHGHLTDAAFVELSHSRSSCGRVRPGDRRADGGPGESVPPGGMKARRGRKIPRAFIGTGFGLAKRWSKLTTESPVKSVPSAKICPAGRPVIGHRPECIFANDRPDQKGAL